MTVPRRSVRRTGGFRRGTRSPTGWAGGATENTLASGTKAIVLSFTSSGLASHDTVVRIVGSISGAADAVVNGQFVLGAGVFADNAVAAGVAFLPDPLTDVNDDLWTMIRSVPYIGSQVREFEFDSRGMRKVEEGQQLVFIGANSASGANFKFSVYLRLLAKSAIRT